jgi:putative tricarboxylic transport membrane protein
MTDILNGFAHALSFANLAYAIGGCLLGTLVGVLPGLGPASAMAILLPTAIYLPPDGAIIVLSAIYYGAMYGGSTTAILMNIPGEIASVVTTMDGFAMTKQGRAGEALAIAGIGSFIAGIGGTIALAFIGPSIANLALAFGPPEYFGLVIFSMVALISFSGESLVKGMIAGIFGMWLATIGTDPLTGAQRLNLGSMTLMRGFDLIPIVIGLFGIGEVFATAQANVHEIYRGKLPSFFNMLPRGKNLVRGLAASVRGTVSGFLLGILPGMLPALTAYIAYDVERRVSKHPEEFGKGAIEGVAGPEAANNATAMGGFIPLFSLGIPTSPAIAIMLGALMINGVQPGPLMYEQHADLVWTVIASMFIANTILLILNLPLVGLWARLSQVPYKILGPIILAVCFIGAYAPRNSMFDVWAALGFGLLSCYLRRYNWPAAPLILGFLMGPLLEQATRQSVELTGSFQAFLSRPIVILFLAAAMALVALMTWLKSRSREMATLMKDSANEV